MGRTELQLAPGRCGGQNAASSRTATSLALPDWAVERARAFARDEVSRWLRARGNTSTNATDTLFGGAGERRMPFFPLYTFLRGLSGDRMRIDRHGNVSFAASGVPPGRVPPRFARVIASLHSNATAVSNYTAAEVVSEFSTRYRILLSTVPTPIYPDYVALFDAMDVALAPPTAVRFGIDYLRYPGGRAVLSGRWPTSTVEVDATFEHAAAGADEVVEGLPAWTRYAQARIAASQQLRPGETCTTARSFVQYLPPYGLGAAMRLAAVWLGHAIITGRLFVVHPVWKRWTGLPLPPTRHCASLGWACFFVPPSPCLWSDIDVPLRWRRSGKGKYDLSMRSVKDRVVVRWFLKSPDLRLRDLPELLPPGVSRSDLERAAGMRYDEWAQRQLLRYLLRAMQPWAELVVLQELYRAGFPWDTAETLQVELAARPTSALPEALAGLDERPAAAVATDLARRPIVATHYRNGDYLYNNEVAPLLKCGQLDTSLTVAVMESVIWELHRALAPGSSGGPCMPRYFFSFDHFGAVRHAEQWFGQSRERGEGTCGAAVGLRANVPVLDTNVTFRGRKDDARTIMYRMFGGGYVIRVSLGNLFLAAAADAWVNNDASNWAMTINYLRYTGGQGRHRAPYVDIKEFAEASPRQVMQVFCNIVGPDTTWDRAGWRRLVEVLRRAQANATCGPPPP